MVLERRRTIICKSSSDLPKTKTPHESRPRSKRVHHSRPTPTRQNQHDFDRDEDVVQADLIEISLVRDPVPVRDDSDSISDTTELVEKLIESARGGNLLTFQRLCTRMMQCHLRLDAPGYMGWTAAHWAAREGHVHLLEHLTMLHANLDAVDWKGDTLLHKAAANGQPAACEWLIERGFSAKLRNNNNLTPLDLAQEHIAISRRSNAALLCEKMLSTEYSEHSK
ncbi:hypothetical protein PHYSODRAFT_474111 [Phytophthora sojae]|uniref:Uncharacterized protein n=1 Tax=Phytophthora sojae (strain P6497) TaxID=1094619 RepID=G4YIY7_PHYSP|nr:hypothetical protein PHYSODRAFT_474111 [Phytophthora sojae]EGZ28809.1 hypothetical protein PHYSODRAFT_474111 [Phytophthora sojae]|eukprot:XP_009516084.1 hypothetical protein PHYSODRAFT_474111 [Phytophthora sojae]